MVKKMSKIKSRRILGLSIFFLIILILFFSFYKILSHGIRIERLHLGGISAKQLYLKLDNKFILELKELNLQKILNKPSSTPFDIEKIAKSLRYFTWGIAYFQNLNIKSIILDKDKIASITYDGKQYKLLFPSINAVFDIKEDTGKLNLDIQNLMLTDFDSNIKGKIAYIPTRHEMAFNLNVTKEKNTLFIIGSTDLKRIKINLKSSALTSLDFLKTPLKDIDNPDLKSWLFEKIFFDQAIINSLSFSTILTKKGFLPGLESTLEGKISINAAEVSLFNDIDSLKAKKITATLKNKKIELNPENLTYGQTNLEGSTISFENLFSHPKMILNIKSPSFFYSTNLTDLLDHYDINIPLEQIDSPLKADLRLAMEFMPDHMHKVSFSGGITTQHSNLKLYGIPLYADLTNINFDITPSYKYIYIKTNGTYYYNMLTSDLDGVLDLVNSTYKTQAKIYRLAINTNQNINFEQPFLKKDFKHNPEDFLDAKTNKQVNDEDEDEEGEISSPNKATQNTQNTQNTSDLDTETLIEKESIQDENSSISNPEPSLEVNTQSNQPIDTQTPDNEDKNASSPESIAQENNTTKTASKLDKTFTKDPNKMAPIELKRLIINSIKEDEKPYTQEILSINGSQDITLDIEIDFKDHDNIMINLPDFKTSLTINPNNHIFKLDDMAKYRPYSPLIQYLDIKSGNAYITTQDFKDFTLLFSIDQSTLPLYDFNGIGVKTLDFSGTIQNDVIQISSLDKKISFVRKNAQNKINIKGYNFNLEQFFNSKIPAIQQALHGNNNGISPTKEQVKNKLEFLRHKHQYQRRHHIKAEITNIEIDNMSIYYKDYLIPTDSISIRFRDQRILADATYKNGIANLDFIDGDIYIKATNFSANFVNFVTQKNLFNGGLFTLIGAYKNSSFSGELKVQNTLFKNFAVLQNIINLIDTVPSLIVFKNPNLGAQGYQVKNGSITFAINKEYLGLEKIHLIGDSMDVDGNGVIQLDSKEINANLKISTIKNLSSILSKIPIVGFLVLGEGGKISTNVTLNGTIEDPKTSVSLAEDIITAPFKILRRVFTPIDVIVDEIKTEMKDEEYRK